MKKLFKKASVFGDIHFGKGSLKQQFNDECEKFVDWFIEQSKINGCETCIFLGDWHDSRKSLDLATMNQSIRCLQKLNDSFEKTYMLIGNHDCFYRERIDIHSLVLAKNFSNIEIIDDIKTMDNCTFVSWLVGEEWKKLQGIKSKYVFGHFELPFFKVNGDNIMPDKGELKGNDFSNVTDYVFSGHFHSRQIKKNIIYIGNCFPHNYGDADDFDRGMMVLEWDKEPKFINWTEMPVYKNLKLSAVLNNPSELNHHTYARITIDINLTYEESIFIKDTISYHSGAKEFMLIPSSTDSDEYSISDSIEYQNVDQIVSEGINSIINSESNTNYDYEYILDIYNNAEV